MPTILTHPAVPLAIGVALGSRAVSKPLLLAGVIASALPDLDVIAFRFGLAYAHDFGHRGASHSILFALVMGLLASLAARPLRASRGLAFLFVFVAGLSHPLLDMCTNGGLGAALWWPFSDERFFFPAQVIEASPLSLRRFLSPAGAKVLGSELLWVWLPCMAVALAALLVRRRKSRGVRGENLHQS